MSIPTFKPVDQFASAKSLVIKQNYITSDYCCCCWKINGKYYEIRTCEESQEDGTTSTPPLLFRADENLDKFSISIMTETDGLMFVQLIGSSNHCQCGAVPVWHRKIDVICTPGELVGSIHYSNPSNMLMKDSEGEPLFRLMRITPPVTNPLQRASIVDVDPKFQVFSVNPEYSEPLSTIWRKGGGSKNEIKKYSQNQKGGFNIVMNFDDSLDLEAKCIIFGAAFPIGLEYYESSIFEQDQYGMPMPERRSSHRSSRTSKT